jgi:hypothetical protein
MSTRIALSLSLSACLFAAACQSDEDPISTDDSALEEARTAAVTVDNASEPAYVGSLLTGSASASAGNDAGGVIAAVQANLALLFALPSCTVISNVVIDTSGPSSLDVTFDSCTDADGNLLLDGSLHAKVAVSGDPLTLDYSLETDGLTVGDRTIAGAWDVHHVLGEGTSTWSGDLTVDGPDGTLTSSTDATFAVNGLCVTYGLDADVQTPSGRSLSVHADQVTRCLDACPTSGSVQVTGGAEGALSWTYDGTGSVTATGSANGSVVIDLSCE